MSETGKDSWFCSMADRMGLTGANGKDASAPGANLWRPLLVRHAARCPRCRAERVANERLVEALTGLRRERAPDSLLPAALARIAAEAPGRTQRTWSQRTSAAYPARLDAPPAGKRSAQWTEGFQERWDLAAALCIVALLLGWVGLVSAPHTAAGLLRAGAAQAESALLIFFSSASDAVAGLSTGASLVPAGVQPYLTAAVWSAFGLCVALLVIGAVGPRLRPVSPPERLG